MVALVYLLLGCRAEHALAPADAGRGTAGVETSRGRGPSCSNGSQHDCNVAGATLDPRSAYLDPSSPQGWTQCAGFVNTGADDVAPTFLDHCLGTTGLRIRVVTSDHVLEEDAMVTGMSPLQACAKDEPFECRNNTCMSINTTR